ncbi:MAG: efflux RND transporter permease subunit, partial [Hyphomicrobiaceae bacterium]
MFRWLIGSSLKFRFLVMAAAAVMVLYGMDRLRHMPVDVFPEFAPPLVEIQTEGPGMSASEVEELITIPLEEQLRGTPGLHILRSQTVNALSAIRLIFKLGTDVLDARRLVQERLQLAIPSLPLSAGMPVILQPLSSTSRVMKIGLTSKTMDMMDLSMVAYWKIKFRLMGVPGVANVPIWGERIKSLQVQIDPEKLRGHGITVDHVVETTSDALDFGLIKYTSAGKTRIDGIIDTPNQRLAIHHELPVVGPEDMAKVPVKTPSGRFVTMGDLGKVVWDTWPLIGDGVINDGPGLMMIVEKLPWANTLDVTRGIDAALEALKPGLQGIEIDSAIFRPATFIELSIENLAWTLLIGAALVVIILGLFLFEWRVALISLIAIPLSLVAAGIVLYLLNTTINTMVLAGFVIALGSVVDDAIIDVENIVRRLRQSHMEGSDKTTLSIILDASLEIRSPIMYATLIIVLAVMPVFFLGGLTGAFFTPLAFAYSLAMLASMVVALTVTPALCLMLLDKSTVAHRQSPLVPWLQQGYDAILQRVMRIPRTTFAVAGVVLLSGIWVWPYLGQSLLPNFKERDFLMHWVTPPGTSHPEMYRITVQSSLELRAIPGVRNFGAHIGRAVGGDEPYGVNFTENWVSLDPKVDYNKTLAAIEEVVEGYPGIYRDVQTYLRERIKEVLTGASESIVVRIFGPELPILREKAEEVKKAITGIPGLVDLKSEYIVEIPQIEVKVNLAEAVKYGLKPGDVRRAAAALMAGQEVTDIHRDGKVYDVFVWSMPEKRKSLTDLREMLIDLPRGGHVRLADVAEVALKPAPNMIKRENVSRRIDVHANVKGRDLGSVAREVEARVNKISFPLEYRAEMLGEYVERQAAQRALLGLAAAVAIGILLLMQASFGSWRLAGLVFLALPAALVGGVLAAFAGDRMLSLGSLIGFLTVLGIAARNGILLIHHFQHLEREEGEPFGLGLVMRGARERLSPILMTTLCTGLALLPLAITGDIPGHEIEHPMAVVILGGLVTSTFLTLFVIPALYLMFGKSGQT